MSAGSFDPVRTARAPSGVGAQPDTCLYYPYFAVRDEQWLKKVLVWWDRVATIVPVDVDFEQVVNEPTRILAEAEAFQAWPVERAVRDSAARAAIELIDQGRLMDFPDAEPVELHFGKLTRQLVEELRARDQVVRVRQGRVLVRGKAAMLVMEVLAHALADQTGASPLTDERAFANAYVGLASRRRLEGGAVDIVEADLELTIPNLESIPLRDWLSFRTDHRGELEVYRSSIRKLAREIAHASDRDEVDDILAERKHQVEEEVRARKSVFRKLTSETSVATLALLAAIGEFIPHPAIASAIAVGAAGAVVAKQVHHPEVHQLSFLTKAARKLG